MRTDQVLWYIWQQDRDGVDRVRVSSHGFEEKAGSIDGDASVGKALNLWVREDRLAANEA